MTTVRENRLRAIHEYGYLRKRAVRKFCRPGLERSDVEQIAAIGLIKACDRYDSTAQTPFEAYAWLFIVGELMHYVRDHERLIRPPRKLRALERLLQSSSESLAHELGREPTIQEQIRRVGCTRLEADEVALYRQRSVIQSLDSSEAGNTPSDERIEHVDDALVVDKALSLLSHCERAVVVAVYRGGYTQSEVAARLGYSTRHISRMHRTALKKMQRACVSDPGAPGHCTGQRYKGASVKHQRGFTLLEMMVVVAIIAILAGILIPNFARARAQAATSGCMANEKNVATALELYFTDHQAYPPDGPIDSSFVATMAGYMSQIPVDPAAGTGQYYTYAASNSGGVTTYTITCPGAHDPGTLMTITRGTPTQDTKIKYDSQGGFSTTP